MSARAGPLSQAIPGLVLFDLDGTLTDPLVGITRSVQFALRSLGLEVAEPAALIAFIGPPLQDAFEALTGLGPDDAVTAVAAYREYFAAQGIYENALYPGIPGVLRSLREDGAVLGVATSKPTVFANQILEHFGLAEYFDAVSGAELDGSVRHKHDVIERALENLPGSLRSGAVMVGDREHDIIGAQLCGLPALGVLWGYGDAEELSAAGAVELVGEVAALRGALQRRVPRR
jgi:phosphoglycolate phosphatase